MSGRGNTQKLYGQKVGVLGGTFDPVHNGHLAVAGHVLNVLQLDAILFIPSARPPHKGHLDLTPFHHRLAMLESAVKNEPHYFVSPMEEQRGGPSYSVDTLQELRDQLGREVRLFFIIGMDAFVEIDTWKDYRLLVQLADLVIIDRPDYPLALVSQTVPKMGDYRFNAGEENWQATDNPGKIFAVSMTPIDVSSTMVRRRVSSSQPVKDCLPPAVADYIARQGLFL